MMGELDNSMARQLSGDIRDLALLVAKLETGIARWGPLVESHVLGLAQVDNRLSRQEEWRASLEKRLSDEKDEQEKRVISNRWMLGFIGTATGLAIQLLSKLFSR